VLKYYYFSLVSRDFFSIWVVNSIVDLLMRLPFLYFEFQLVLTEKVQKPEDLKRRIEQWNFHFRLM